MKISNLKDTTPSEKNALFFKKFEDIEVILYNGYVATTANSNGAINVHKDDFGIIHVEASRHLISFYTKTFARLSLAKTRINSLLKQIK